MSEPQLERSVLESKEREELLAIANALGTRPTSRAKKSDLVTAILRATGVESADEEPERPRRPRTRRAAGSAPVEAGEASGVASTGDGVEGQADAETGTATAVSPGSGSARAETTGSAKTAKTAKTAGSTVAAGTVEDATSAVEADHKGAVSSANGIPERVEATAGRAGGPVRTAGRSQPGFQGASPRANGTNGHGAGSGQSASPPMLAGSAAASSQSSSAQSSSAQSSSAQTAQIARPAQSAGGGSVSVGSAAATGGEADSDGARFDNESGGRRNRRRRGRDRNDRSERELQGQSQASETQYAGEPIPVSGLLDLRDEGYGFLRTTGFIAGHEDVYVSISQVRRFSLRKGDFLDGGARPAGNNEKYPALLRIDSISGLTPDEARSRPRFDSLTPLFPDQKLALEVPGDSANTTARIVDLISPIGKGQRGLIVSPPKAGKTTVLKQIAHSIEANNPDVHLMVLLVDERPEEVTDMRRSVKGEVIASTFDRPSEEHTQVAELAIERAKRMVEQGRDVVIVLDGITRLARAYNLAQPATGRVMSGGIDTGALYPPKKFFGAARNIEEGGSLTILATALVETGSKMDEVIFEEFKGTGNMELRLDRRLAERRIYPAIDVNGSSTRHEELLFDRTQLQQVWKLRRALNALAAEGSSAASLELLMDKIKATRSNDEFLAELAKNPATAV